MNNTELKPCPFCGSTAIRRWGEQDNIIPWIQCENCMVSTGTYETKEEAIEAWNRRV